MISVVIPNYNGEGLLKKNLPKILELLKESKLEFEIIVVDDASTDDSRSVLEPFARPGLANIIYRRQNGGFPVAVDQGIREARGEIIFNIKNDAVPLKSDYFKLMLEHFKNKEVFAVSAGLRTVENNKEEIRGSGVIYFEKGIFKHGRGSNESKITAWADGGSSAFNKAIYLKIGGFDPVYRPGYWEDVDLGYRAWKAGYRVDFEPQAVLLHDFESGVFKKKYGERQIRLINLRNQFIFTWKNADFSNLLKFFQWEIYNHLAAVKSGNHDFIKAYWMAVLRLPEIIKSRIFQKKINKFTDSEVLRTFFASKHPKQNSDKFSG